MEAGKAEMYSFSYGNFRLFFLGAEEGRAGPKPSSEEDSTSVVSFEELIERKPKYLHLVIPLHYLSFVLCQSSRNRNANAYSGTRLGSLV